MFYQCLNIHFHSVKHISEFKFFYVCQQFDYYTMFISSIVTVGRFRMPLLNVLKKLLLLKSRFKNKTKQKTKKQKSEMIIWPRLTPEIINDELSVKRVRTCFVDSFLFAVFFYNQRTIKIVFLFE